ncbi:MAG: IPT/TIG domain-containing protein [Candidatus Sericytochromatia bacterium]
MKSVNLTIVGKRYLEGKGESIQLNAVLKDAAGNMLNPADFPLDWLSSRPQDFWVDNTGKVVAQTDYGYSQVTVRVKGTDVAFQQLVSVSAPASPVKREQPSSAPRPVVNSISPIGGTEGASLVIQGENFSGATKVFFGNTPATSFTLDSNTQITARVPAGSGTVDVSVARGSKKSAAVDYIYTTGNYTYSWPADQTRTKTPNIPSGTSTTFTSYLNNFNYLNLPFTVPATGNYTFTITTSPVANTSWIVDGLFEPSVTPTDDPVTPLANFIVGNFTSPGFISTLSEVTLQAGQQYTLLTAFNTNGSPDDTLVATFVGPDGAGIIPTNPE